MGKNLVKIIVVVVVIGAVYGILKYTGVTESVKLENVPKIRAEIERFGAIAPLVYIGFYIVATVFFLPGLPITVLSGVAFGPFWGVVYVSIAATIGVSLAFLIARYTARDLIERKVTDNETFKKIDDGVEKHGWRMVMITRLVPLFPFNLQNYAYGLTKIHFGTYALVSWICMLPGTIAYVQAGGALVSGGGNLKKTLIYLAIAGVLIAIVSFVIPRLVRQKEADIIEEEG